MPQLLRVGPYCIFFWSNENEPLEPIHVHIAEGKPSASATKIWITSKGKTLLCNNNSGIPETALKRLLKIVEANSGKIQEEWISFFGEIKYFC
jgi:hypothetical protein